MSDVSIKEWILAARPKTLTAAFMPVLCGHLIVNLNSQQHVSITLSTLALLCAVLIQIGTNFFNDVIDYRNGVDSDQRSGPRRLLQMGRVSETRMRAAAHVCFFGAFIAGFPLVIKGGLVVLAIGIISIIIGYSYSAPPLKIAYRGFAEPFVVLFFGVIAVLGVEWLHTRSVSTLAIICGLQLGLLATVLMVINNVRDFAQDSAQGKLTLVARFGTKFGIIEVISFYALVLLLNFTSSISILPLQICSFIWVLPALIVIQNLVFGRKLEKLNQTLAIAAFTHLLFGICRAIQFIWST